MFRFGTAGFGKAVQVWTDELSYGLVCSGKARRSGQVLVR